MKKRNYDDIINLPYIKSTRHPHMSIHDRAAQFAPFAALSGHGDAVSETARYVDERAELGEDAVLEITESLNYIQNNIKSYPEVLLTYFVPDIRKKGGRYVTEKCHIKKIDNISQVMVLDNDKEIMFDSLLEIHVYN